MVAYVVALTDCDPRLIAVRVHWPRGLPRAAPTRAVNLRSLFLGLVIYLGLWLLAAAFAWNPIVGSVLHGVALAGSWVAVTFGLGATVLTRAGTRRDGDRARKARPVDDMSWATPTPVTGVVAARRPVATAKEI